MRFLPSRLLRFNSLGLLVVAMVMGSACENKHIGRPCGLSADPSAGGASGSGTVTTLDVALECPSRICLLPARVGANATPPTTSLCTADCSSDDDCSDGEIRNDSDPNDNRCAHGFVCTVAETVGDFCCRRLCVCKDFIGNSDTSTPEVCKSTADNKAICKNIQ